MYRTWGLLWTAAKMVLCIIHLWCGPHTWNTTTSLYLVLLGCWVRYEVRPVLTHTMHTTWYSPRLDQILYRVAFYEEIWLGAQTSCNLSPECLEFPRSRIYFSPGACALDVQASGILKGFMSDVLVNLTLQSRLSWFLDCHKYWVDIFIRVPFIHKKSGIKATNY